MIFETEDRLMRQNSKLYLVGMERRRILTINKNDGSHTDRARFIKQRSLQDT